MFRGKSGRFLISPVEFTFCIARNLGEGKTRYTRFSTSELVAFRKKLNQE
jgi:hypothetical protein